MKEIKCVIMDWAGTAVDYGCFAPLKAFLKVFKEEKASKSPCVKPGNRWECSK